MPAMQQPSQAVLAAPQPKQAADVLALIEDITSNADAVQHAILSQILQQNSSTEYLRRLIPAARCADSADSDAYAVDADIANADAAIDPHTFKRIAPLTSYEDVQPFIRRIADGDKAPILTGHPVFQLLRSSGTSSGVEKLIPTIEADLQRRKWMIGAMASLSHRDLGDLDDGKDASFQFGSPEARSAGGVPVLTVIASLMKSPNYQQYLRERHTSPIEVVECEDVRQSTYCQLLFGLLQRQEVVKIGAIFASGVIYVIQVLKDKWRELVKDIQTGSLNEAEVFDLILRRAVKDRSGGPNPALAMQVEEECRCEPMWQGIIHRLWPKVKYLQCAVSGSMEQYIPMLEFYSGGLPLITTGYGASEGMFGINMNPLCSPYEVSYTILPNMAYFEFLPLDTADDATPLHQSHLVDLVNVKVGQEYEIVVTTFAGLYRYRVGDCLRVTGFYNKTPQFHLIGRKNVVLSIGVDKTEEATLQKAVHTAKVRHLEARSSCQLVDYTSYTDVSIVPGHYVLFWEVRDKFGEAMELMLDSEILEACAATVEECLDDVYRRGRGSWIGPLEIRVVRQGTFHALTEYTCLANGVSIAQYKTPRVVKLAPLLELLNSSVSHSFSSPNCPSS